jgi:DeoR family transcriptional regulator of aga operon
MPLPYINPGINEFTPPAADKVERRRRRVIEQLSSGRKFKIEELVQALGVAAPTLRRDLREMEQEGLVRREHGAVTLADPSGLETLFHDPGFRDQLHHMAEEKRRIGMAAAALVPDGATVGMVGGSTTMQMARSLKSKRDLTIVTNALVLPLELSRKSDITIHLTGGHLSRNWLTMVGPRALDFIQTMFVDLLFIGANGIHPVHGVTDRHVDEATVHAAFLKRAKKRILVADHTKFREVAKCVVCPMREVETIVTDRGADDETVAPFRALGLEVLQV